MLPQHRLRRGGPPRCLGVGAALEAPQPRSSTASRSSARTANLAAPIVVWPTSPEWCCGRLLPARAAGRASAARYPAVRQPRLRGGVAHDLRPRRGALRGDDPRAPLLPGSPPRERHRHRPARRPAGPRDDDRDAARWAASPLASEGGAWRCRCADPLVLGTMPIAFVGAGTSILDISPCCCCAESASASPSSLR